MYTSTPTQNGNLLPGSTELRADFPLLARRRVVYLDSAATSLKPMSVLVAEQRYSTDYTANVHRGCHQLSEEVSEAFEQARRELARFLGAEPRAVVFTRGTTEAINMVARGLGLRLGDVVYVPTVAEHHANLAPWMQAARLVVGSQDPFRPIDPEELRRALIWQHPRPRVLAFAAASHVTGVIQPAAALCHVARELGIISVVDAAQAAPHLPIDVRAMGCDYLALSGHKMLGPTGVGVLTGQRGALERLRPLLTGGGCLEDLTLQGGLRFKPVPERLEAGTPNISGVLGLAAAVRYLQQRVGFDALRAHEARLATLLAGGLAELQLQPLQAQQPPRLALACIGVEDPDRAARQLSSQYGIMARSGYHCAYPFFDAARVKGAVRLSCYLYTTEDEVRYAISALQQLAPRRAWALGGLPEPASTAPTARFVKVAAAASLSAGLALLILHHFQTKKKHRRRRRRIQGD